MLSVWCMSRSCDCCGQVLFEAFLFCFLFCVERHENCSDLLRTKNNVFWFEKIVDKRENTETRATVLFQAPKNSTNLSSQAHFQIVTEPFETL